MAATGAKPLAVTDCLNFGSPEDPEVMWQFAEACRGLADACLELGTPVTGGNVSFYNQTGELRHPPDPGRRRARRDRRRRPPHPQRLRAARARSCCCSATPATSSAARSGRTWCTATSAACRRAWTWGASGCSAEVLIAGSRDGMLSAAHDLSDGGLVAGGRGGCLRGGHGARLVLPETDADGDALDPFVALFSESAGRALVARAAQRGAAVHRHVRVPRAAGGARSASWTATRLEVQGQFSLPAGELRRAHTHTFPALFG